MQVCTERAAMLSARVAKLVALRRSERANRKLALVIFNFPPNSGNVGTAAYLSVFESLFNTLKTLSNEGYNIDVPANADVLREMVLNGNREMYGADANVHHIIPTSEHVRNERWLKQIEAQWGPAPGKLLTNGQGLFVQGVQLGQALVCIQPA
mgnify:CR=1 FL=1